MKKLHNFDLSPEAVSLIASALEAMYGGCPNDAKQALMLANLFHTFKAIEAADKLGQPCSFRSFRDVKEVGDGQS